MFTVFTARRLLRMDVNVAVFLVGTEATINCYVLVVSLTVSVDLKLSTGNITRSNCATKIHYSELPLSQMPYPDD